MSGPETRAPRLGALSLRARASLAVIAVFFCARHAKCLKSGL